MTWAMVRFFFMMTAVFSLSHLVIYLSFRFLLNVGKGRLLFWSILVLGVSFPLTMMAGRLMNNLLTQSLSLVSGLWFGISIYFLGVFVLLWAARAGLYIYHLVFPGFAYERGKRWFVKISWGLVAFALLFSLYGFVNALNLKPTGVSVEIENLPDYWKGKKIVHISDVHLGGVWGNGHLERMTEMIDEIQPEITVITGDLFDGSSRHPEFYLEGLKTLARAKSTQGVYFVSGNHERYSNYDKNLAIVKESGIHPLENKIIQIAGLQWIGIAYPDLANFHKQPLKPWLPEKDPAFKKSLPSILLYHTPTEYNDFKKTISQMQKSAYTSPNTKYKTARSIGIDLQLSGHSHAGQFFPITLVAQRLYNGFHYGLHRVGDFQIYVHSGTGTWGPPIRHIYPTELVVITLK